MKRYMRIASKYETQFNGYNVPRGACYGRNNESRFVCKNYSGLTKGILDIIVQTGSSKWTPIRVTRKDWRYKAVLTAIRETGYIPKVGTFRNPYKRMYIPSERKVNYNYLPTGSGAGQLVRMSHDNADHSGGGSNVQNSESYWTIYKDMERRCAVNPLYE